MEDNHIEDFVRLKLAAFDLSEATKLESNQVVDWLRTLYLDRAERDLENKLFDLGYKYKSMEQSKWLCKCGEINTGQECKSLRPNIEHVRVKWLENQDKAKMSSTEDLFSKFYKDEKVLISSMSSEDFILHEQELAKIAFEAKARLTAVVDHKREENAKLRANQKEWLVPRSDAEDQLVSDAINTVNTRKKRMNKIEKLDSMLSGFVDEETRKQIVQNIERKATDKQVNLISFVKTKVEETKKEDAESKAEENNVEKKPF